MEELVINVGNPIDCVPADAFVKCLLVAKASNIRRVDFRGVNLSDPVFNELMSLVHRKLEVFSFALGDTSLSCLDFAASSLLKFPSQNLKELAFAQALGGYLKVLASLPVLKQIETLTIEIVDDEEDDDDDDDTPLSHFKALLNGLKGGCLKSFALDAPTNFFFEFLIADLPALESLSCCFRGADEDSAIDAISEANIPLLRHLKLSSLQTQFFCLPDSFASKDRFPLLESFEIHCQTISEESCNLLASRVPSLRSLQLSAALIVEDWKSIFSQSALKLKSLIVRYADDEALLELAVQAANMPLLEELAIRFSTNRSNLREDKNFGLKVLITAGKWGAWSQLRVFRCGTVTLNSAKHLCGPLYWPNLEKLIVEGIERGVSKDEIRDAHRHISIEIRYKIY